MFLSNKRLLGLRSRCLTLSRDIYVNKEFLEQSLQLCYIIHTTLTNLLVEDLQIQVRDVSVKYITHNLYINNDREINGRKRQTK